MVKCMGTYINFRSVTMAIKTIIFDLDDTLLFDQQSVKTAFEKTCDYAATQKTSMHRNWKKQ